MKQRIMPILGLIIYILMFGGCAAEPEDKPLEQTTLALTFPDPRELPSIEKTNPLIFFDGTKVKNLDDWKKRREEIIQLAQHYIYGFSGPEALIADTTKPEVLIEDKQAFDGVATKYHIKVYLVPPDKDPEAFLGVDLCIPNKGTGPFPTILSVNNGLPKTDIGFDAAGNRIKIDRNLALIHMLEQGYAVAGLKHSTEMYRHYFPIHSGPWVKGNLYRSNEWRPLTSWGYLAACAWRARRVTDALIQQKQVDPKRIIVAGGSRFGKVALLTAALEPRVALCYIWQGIPRIRNYNWPDRPYWFTPNLQLFNSDAPTLNLPDLQVGLKKLPIDNDCLLATLAPRPVLFSVSRKGGYGSYHESFYAYNQAQPVYAMFGCTFEQAVDSGVGKDGQYGKGPIALHIRDGGHAWELQDWEQLVQFANKELKP